MASPNWAFDDATYERTSASFENPDFVAVVVHSYRHRYALAEGDPRVADIEAALAARPTIGVPSIALDGEGDGVQPAGVSEAGRKHFSGPYEVRRVPRVGHNLPQEAPREFAEAVLDLI